jgi:hypothetical protein
MDFVFGHEAEPLPGGDGCGAGSLAFALKVGVGEAGEDFHGFSVKAIHEGEDVIEAVGEFLALGSEAGGFVLDGFGPHITFGYGDVTQEIAECEFPGGVGPIDFIGRDAAGDAEGAFADVGEVVEEGLNGEDFHGVSQSYKRLTTRGYRVVLGKEFDWICTKK